MSSLSELSTPRAQVSDELISSAIDQLCPQFGIESLKPLQRLALCQLVRGDDVLACFPTGFGKSLLFHMLPSVCSVLRTSHSGLSTTFPVSPIVVVAAPLLSLMRDQVATLMERGVSAAMIGASKSSDVEIKAGNVSVVFGSPEVLLGNSKWRMSLQERNFRDRVVAIVADEVHTVVQWGGVSAMDVVQDDSEPFRVWCGLVGELRSLLSAPLLALTATASRTTKDAIIRCLGMTDRCYEITKSPDRDNIYLSVEKVNTDLQSTFDFLLKKLKSLQVQCPRVLVYCQTQSVCSDLYTLFHSELGDKGYWPVGCRNPQNRIVEMYHSCTPDANKGNILQSLRHSTGCCRVVFATNALGMGIDVKGLTSVIHYGPSADLESYMQEIGRAGRDGRQSSAYLLYHGQQLRHTRACMKDYIKNTNCRRATLLSVFDAEPTTCIPQHTCCDVCATTCQCCSPDQCSGLDLLGMKESSATALVTTSTVLLNDEQRELLEFLLLEYRMMEEAKLGVSHQPLYTKSSLVTGLTDSLLHSVLENAGQLHTVNDIQALTPVFSFEHAQGILAILLEAQGQSLSGSALPGSE